MIGDGASLQVVRSGEPLSLLVSRAGVQVLDAEAGEDALFLSATTDQVADALAGTPFAGMANATQAALEMFGAMVLGQLDPQVSLVHLCWLRKAYIAIRVVPMPRIAYVEKSCPSVS